MKKIITIDGPGGVGKGTLAQKLAKKMGWQWLDSGAIYRLLALSAIQSSVPADDVDALTKLATVLDVVFSVSADQSDADILLDGHRVNEKIRTETCATFASKAAALEPVRAALLERQRLFATEPGLVTDGRDMGTVVFPKALLKIFLTASATVRAQRRRQQLLAQGVDVSMRELIAEIEARDHRDQTRAIAPLVPAQDSVVIDTSDLSIDRVFETVCDLLAASGVLK